MIGPGEAIEDRQRSMLTRAGLLELPKLALHVAEIDEGDGNFWVLTPVNGLLDCQRSLLGRERQQTQAVREDDARGRHTTTSRELILLPSGALLIDTPGLRALEVAGADEGFDSAFADVAELAAACRFGDYRHQNEPGCAVRSAVEAGSLPADRFEAFRKLERELAFEVRKTDPRAAAENRRRWKLIHSSVQRQMRERYGGDWR